MKEIYLIRHGKVENPSGLFYGRSRDIPLSELGRSQILTLGNYFNTINITPDKIISSPLLRAVQTAEILKSKLTCPKIELDPRLFETYSKGLEGRALAELDLKINLYTDPDREYIIEKPELIIRRVSSIVEEVLDSDKRITFLISHGDPLSFYLFRLQNPTSDFPNDQLLRNQGLQQGQVALLRFNDLKQLPKIEKIDPY